jgi:CO dehydrogenase maturation factor
MRRVLVLANKIRTPDEIQFVKENLPSFEILGFLPYDEEVLNSSKLGISPYDTSSKLKREIIKMKKKLVQNGEAAN